jgi:hypothetical protein
MHKNKKPIVYKNIIFLVLITCFISVLLTATVSCNISVVRGSGNVISEDRAVSGFSKVLISGSGEIFIEQGDEESLTIKAEDNIIPLITTEVSGDTLNISHGPGPIVTNTKSIEIYLRVKDLDSISTSGSANINCSGLSTSNLIINTTGSGNVVISNLENDSIDIGSSGSGNFTLAGNTNSLKISTNGSGGCDAENLKSKDCIIDVNGSGNITVNVSDTLDASIDGSGNISYSGNPTVESTKGFGASGVIKNISE